jgi:hypothetical protein
MLAAKLERHGLPKRRGRAGLLRLVPMLECDNDDGNRSEGNVDADQYEAD